MRFESKPVIVEGVQIQAVEYNDLLNGEGGLFKEVPEWLEKAIESGDVIFGDDLTGDYTMVSVLNRTGNFSDGHADDWIIKLPNDTIDIYDSEDVKLLFREVD